MTTDSRLATPPSRSLEDIHASVPIPRTGWRRFLAFAGPAFLVSVGYMDPGNWGTDIQAGSAFGYRLLWVLLLSNLMAVLLQCLSTRLGVVTGNDLAQACRETYPRFTSFGLWILTEIAIAATDLAEVIGTIIALKLLLGLPYFWGLLVAAGDTFLLLALQRRGVRALELLTLALIAVIGGSFFIELFLFPPHWGAVAGGLIPSFDPQAVSHSLYLAIAMLGATVMPHNLYLHSALVQTRDFPQTAEGRRLACRYNLYDSVLALNGAFFVNAAILVLSAVTFAPREVQTLTQAHSLLHGLWPTALAAGLFAVGLLASGQSSTLTGTLAGQIVMEGFVRLRLRPWLRRLVTRALAILPALVVLALASREEAAGGAPAADGSVVDERLLQLLVLSQAVLSFQLPFAVFPLVVLTGDRRRMGPFANGIGLKVLAWSCAGMVVVLNVAGIALQTADWGEAAREAGWDPAWVYGTVGPLAALLAGFLGWVALYPFWARPREVPLAPATPTLETVHYRRIGVAVEFEKADAAVLAQAAAVARLHHADLVVLHVVEGLGAEYHGPATADQESRADRVRIEQLADHLRHQGLAAAGVLGYGAPADELVRLAQEQRLDLLVLGAHGHRFFADLVLGRTVSPVLHRLTIPVLVVPSRPESDAFSAAKDLPPR